MRTLAHYNRRLAEQARATGWTKREVSEAITYYERRWVLFHPPEE